MAFDWERFFDRNGITFVTKGPNVGRGSLAIKCPLCGSADPSEHLNVSINGPRWKCWRNRSHYGSNRAALITILLNVPIAEAREIAGEDTPSIPSDDLLLAKMRATFSSAPPRSELIIPREVKPLRFTDIWTDPFFSYLTSLERGFSVDQADWIAERYSLRYAIRGRYRYRIFVPISDYTGKLISWTARAILPEAEIRYLTLPTMKSGDDPTWLYAIAQPAAVLLGEEWLGSRPLKALVICEGPFDAMKVSALGYEFGVYGTCLFGLNLTDSQLESLARLRYDRLYLCLDSEVGFAGQRLLDRLAPLGAQRVFLPTGIKDPGLLAGVRGASYLQDLAA